MKNVINSWMLRPDVILKYRALCASAEQVASGNKRKQTNKKVKEKRKGEEDGKGERKSTEIRHNMGTNKIRDEAM
jgi:hypothetical protein